MDYNITIMARMEWGGVIEVTPIRIQTIAAEVPDYMEITDPEEIADTIDLGVTPLLVHVLCFPITALILILWNVATKRMGLKINTVRGNGKVATGMATGGSNTGDRLPTSIITQSIT